ncbi:MAG: M48 family metallopeptidase [Chloroflexi bacterium]|nr:M48 family metallopeptidase [Chloroflexota bacterium]
MDGETTIAFTVVRSARRRKTVTLQVDAERGVTVRAPLRVPAAELRELVRKRSAWIAERQRLIALRGRTEVGAAGSSISYLGRDLAVDVAESDGPRTPVRLRGGRLTVSPPAGLLPAARAEAVRAALRTWLMRRSAYVIRRRVASWAAAMEAQPAAVLIRDQKRRWGSCSADGTLRFNWRLVMLEVDAIDYVVVHELAHLRHRDHGPQFWAVVRAFAPTEPVQRARLRAFSGATEF